MAERESNGRDEFLGRGKFGGDIMALCIMSKCRRKGGGGWFLEEIEKVGIGDCGKLTMWVAKRVIGIKMCP